MIKAILSFNNHGKPRLSKSYQPTVKIHNSTSAGRHSICLHFPKLATATTPFPLFQHLATLIRKWSGFPFLLNLGGTL
uniref:Uncharacterized protein n=1 Tax=Canis lupus dingo TaxID=286419 RepID=A0A8C0LI07_CANLU